LIDVHNKHERPQGRIDSGSRNPPPPKAQGRRHQPFSDLARVGLDFIPGAMTAYVCFRACAAVSLLLLPAVIQHSRRLSLGPYSISSAGLFMFACAWMMAAPCKATLQHHAESEDLAGTFSNTATMACENLGTHELAFEFMAS
jgi:hypothetical protein